MADDFTKSKNYPKSQHTPLGYQERVLRARASVFPPNRDAQLRAVNSYAALKQSVASDLHQLLVDVLGKRISSGTFEHRMKATLRGVYRQAFRLGMQAAGWPPGAEVPVDSKWLTSFQREEWGFVRKFADSLRDGTGRMNPSRRMQLYVNTIDAIYSAGKIQAQSDETLISWNLTESEHCEDCVALAMNSPYTKETLPTQPRAGFGTGKLNTGTRCGSNCKCYLEFLPPTFTTPSAPILPTLPTTPHPVWPEGTPDPLEVPVFVPFGPPVQRPVVLPRTEPLLDLAELMSESPAPVSPRPQPKPRGFVSRIKDMLFNRFLVRSVDLERGGLMKARRVKAYDRVDPHTGEHSMIFLARTLQKARIRVQQHTRRGPGGRMEIVPAYDQERQPSLFGKEPLVLQRQNLVPGVPAKKTVHHVAPVGQQGELWLATKKKTSQPDAPLFTGLTSKQELVTVPPDDKKQEDMKMEKEISPETTAHQQLAAALKEQRDRLGITSKLLAKEQEYTRQEIGHAIVRIRDNWDNPLVGTPNVDRHEFTKQADVWVTRLTDEEARTFKHEWDMRGGLSAIAFAKLMGEIKPALLGKEGSPASSQETSSSEKKSEPPFTFTPQTSEQDREELSRYFPTILARAKEEHAKAMSERAADRRLGSPWPFEIAEKIGIAVRGIVGFTKPSLRVTISHDNPKYDNLNFVKFDMPDPRPGKHQEFAQKIEQKRSAKHIGIGTTTGNYIVQFPYDADLVAAVKRIPGARFQPTAKNWMVPKEQKEALAKFAEKHGFTGMEAGEEAAKPVPSQVGPPPAAATAATEKTLSVFTPGGKEVTVKLYSAYKGNPRVWIELPSMGVKGQTGAPLKLKEPKSGATHYFDLGQGKGVGLSAAEAQKVTDAITKFQDDYAHSEGGRMDALKKERERLTLERAGWLDAMGEARERAFNADTGVGWDKANSHKAKADEVTKKIEAFDMMHPEVVARIQAEKDDAARRFLATN